MPEAPFHPTTDIVESADTGSDERKEDGVAHAKNDFSTMAAVAGDAAKPKLSYFNIRGRGECIRLCLRDNEIEYEEDIIGLGSKSFQDLKREGFEVRRVDGLCGS